jgi:hypothetical protein
MQRVRLTCAVKHDSPLIVGDKDDILTLSDAVAVFAIVNKFGVLHGGPIDNPGPTRAELEAAEAQHGTLKTLDEVRTEEDQPPTEPEPVKRPYGNAPKSAWVRYAASVDPELSEERAEDMTKADLMSKYGTRLGDED